jgi:addiction module HigA family antidote
MTTTNKAKKVFAPVHPGEVLLHDYLEPLGMSQYALAKALGINQARLSELVRGKRAISPDTALRLARYFGTSAEFWIGMQAHYDLEVARDRRAAAIERQVTPRAA